MKKVLILGTSIVLLLAGILRYKDYLSIPAFLNRESEQINEIEIEEKEWTQNVSNEDMKRYVVKKDTNIILDFQDSQEAIEYAKSVKRSVVIDLEENKWIYSSLEPFMIFTDQTIHDFKTLHEAIFYAKRNEYERVYYKEGSQVIWENTYPVKREPLHVPLIMQFPELERGCEVTSLAMLFEYNGKKIPKIQLAEEITKDTTAYQKGENGRVYYGNPYDGFVGDMYSLKKNGYGVYHGPIYELAKNYFGEEVLDLTGLEFEDLLFYVGKGDPVWFVSNSLYRPLEESSFEIWHTPTGIVKITKRMHAGVITGYDENYIYVNDPLKTTSNLKLDRENFKKAWEQMGNQAIVIFNNKE